MNEKRSKAKVYFELNPTEWHGHSSESLWARSLGKGQYQLLNVPFFAKNVSLGDVISAPKDRKGTPRFSRVVSREGHSTCRVVTAKNPDKDKVLRTHLDKLETLGCKFEKGQIQDLTVFAVDVPPSSDIGDVYRTLEVGRKRKAWDWELGFDGHPDDSG